MRDAVGARQSLKRSRDWAEAGRCLLFNYVQTGPLTRFRPGLGRPSDPSAGPAQRAQVAQCVTNSGRAQHLRGKDAMLQPSVIFRGPILRWTDEVLLGLLGLA